MRFVVLSVFFVLIIKQLMLRVPLKNMGTLFYFVKT